HDHPRRELETSRVVAGPFVTPRGTSSSDVPSPRRIHRLRCLPVHLLGARDPARRRPAAGGGGAGRAVHRRRGVHRGAPSRPGRGGTGVTPQGALAGRWTAAEWLRIIGMLGVIAAAHVAGWTLYLYYARSLDSAEAFAGAGTLAYTLGIRHAFDADHIAAVDDTTRLMM